MEEIVEKAPLGEEKIDIDAKYIDTICDMVKEKLGKEPEALVSLVIALSEAKNPMSPYCILINKVYPKQKLAEVDSSSVVNFFQMTLQQVATLIAEGALPITKPANDQIN